MSTSTIDVQSAQQLTRNTLALVLAGGQGTRLFELTKFCAKPALVFGGKFRVIDFTLSNCVNSGIKKIGVLTHYQPFSLIRHISRNWVCRHHELGEFVEVLQSSQYSSTGTYEGTAHAIYQNIAFIRKHNPQFVAILAGDHVYKMNYNDMLARHVQSGADMTISCIEVPVAEAAGNFGVMSINRDNHIVSFQEKPENPISLSDKPGFVLASMGNYIFNTDFLIKQLLLDANNERSEHDFGKDIIPATIKSSTVAAYRYKDVENNPQPYWRDVGTIDSFWQANMDILDANCTLNIKDDRWPILKTEELAAEDLVKTRIFEKKHWRYAVPRKPLKEKISNTSSIVKSSITADTIIGSDTIVCKSVVLPKVKIGRNALIYKAIIDEGCNIPDDTNIGIDHDVDAANGFRVSRKGIVLVTNKMLLNYLSMQKANMPFTSSQISKYADDYH